MDSTGVEWRGSFSAIVTPFLESGELNESAIKANVRMSVDEGSHGLVIVGHNGEAHLMSDDERMRVVEIALEEAGGCIPVLAGTGGIRTESVIRLSKRAEALGVDGVMVEAPYFMTPKAGDLIAHFARISDAIATPIMVYNNPARSGVDLDIALMREISSRANVVAIKETSTSFERIVRLVLNLGQQLKVFVGPSRLFGLAGVQMGASGFVDGMSQIVGRSASLFYECAATPERVVAAIDLQRELFQLGELLFHSSGTSPATIKDAMRLLDRPGGYPRSPLRAMQGEELQRFDREMRKLNIIRQVSREPQHCESHA